MTEQFRAEPVRRYVYRDERGRAVVVQARTASKDIWLERPDGRGGIGGLPVKDAPLFGTERLARLGLEVPVVVTEGPKDCEACWRAGLAAVGTLSAAWVPSAAALSVLRDRVVVLWPDNDRPGLVHMEKVARSLQGIARRVVVVDVSALLSKAGAVDVTPEMAAALVGRALIGAIVRVGSR